MERIHRINSRATRPSRLVPTEDRGGSHYPADVAFRDGLSQLEQGRIVLLDDRTAFAVGKSLEVAIRAICERFGMDAVVSKSAALGKKAVFGVAFTTGDTDAI